jgi:spherulation-specific family 4 protein
VTGVLPVSRPVTLAVPWYAHPAEFPAGWRRLARLTEILDFVVVNVHDGPGPAADPYYPPALGALAAAGVRLVGYVDTDYGRRGPADVLRDIHAWAERYGAAGVMFDRVPTHAGWLNRYRRLTGAARREGMGLVVGNPGCYPDPAFFDVFDVVCAFEGALVAHVLLRVPDWAHAVPASRLWHLVHGVPPAEIRSTLSRAVRSGAGLVHISTDGPPNPWSVLPERLAREVHRMRRPRPGGGSGEELPPRICRPEGDSAWPAPS